MKELTLKEIQAESLIVLKDIDRVCRENNIKYCIFFGTLIGAIRHNGFIPWDDDIDVAMTKDNYEKFLEIYSESGIYRIINYTNEEKCPYMITRISNDDFILKSEFGSDYRIGVFVDIYPFYGVGNNMDEIKKIQKKSIKYSKGLAKSLERNPINNVRKLHNGIKKWLLIPQYFFPRVIGADYYREKLIRLCKIYPYDDSAYIGCSIWYLIINEIFKKEWIEDVIDIDFEDMKVLAPKNYDKVLKQNYGEYMKLPPENMRIAHHFYKVYKK